MEEQVKYEVAELPKITKKDIDDYLYGTGTKLTEPQKAMFYQIASVNGLNPWKREVYAIPYGDRFNVITGYETYLKRAERSGKLAGWSADVTKIDNELVGSCTVYRKDWTQPFSVKAWYNEYNQGNKMWKEKPRTMIRKVAIAQAFRMAFPEELGGMPYTADEMPVGDAEVVQPTLTPPPTQKPILEPPDVNKSPPQGNPEPTKVTDGQLKRLFAIANKSDKSKEDIKGWLKAINLESSKELTPIEYNALILWIETPKPPEDGWTQCPDGQHRICDGACPIEGCEKQL